MSTDPRPEDASARPEWLVRASLPFFHAARMPTYQYLRAEGAEWVTFEEATRFPSSTDTGEAPRVPAPHADAVVEWVPDLPRDLDGWPFDPNDGEYTWRLTRCCAASASISDGPYFCKSCFEEQPPDVDQPPRVDGNWRPADGPITYQLPPADGE